MTEIVRDQRGKGRWGEIHRNPLCKPHPSFPHPSFPPLGGSADLDNFSVPSSGRPHEGREVLGIMQVAVCPCPKQQLDHVPVPRRARYCQGRHPRQGVLAVENGGGNTGVVPGQAAGTAGAFSKAFL